MRAYRHAYSPEGGTRTLSQNGLLDLMAQVDSRYSGRYDHSAVARWESGAIRPNRERLEVFGQALELSAAEIDGLISLAGLDANTGDTAETRAGLELAYADKGRPTNAPGGLNPKSSAVEPNPNVSLVLSTPCDSLCQLTILAAWGMRRHCRLLSGIVRLEFLFPVGHVRRSCPMRTDGTGVLEAAPFG